MKLPVNKTLQATLSGLDNLIVVLVATRNPLNIGAAARAMSNFGFRHLRVVNPYDPSFREARSAVGAAELLQNATQFSTLAEAVADCSLVVGTTAARDRELQHPLLPVAAAAQKVHEHLASQKVALLFGSEKRGLSNEDMSHCHWLLHVATKAQQPSMNLGQAVAVVLYEMAKEEPSVQRVEERASGKTLEALTAALLETLIASGYLKGSAAANSDEKVRRLVHRLRLSEEDGDTLLRMLRKIATRLERS